MEVETSEIQKDGSQRAHSVRIPVMNPASTARRVLAPDCDGVHRLPTR